MAVGFREAASLLGGERSAISGRGRQNKLPGEDVPACQAQTFLITNLDGLDGHQSIQHIKKGERDHTQRTRPSSLIEFLTEMIVIRHFQIMGRRGKEKNTVLYESQYFVQYRKSWMGSCAIAQHSHGRVLARTGSG